MNFAQVFWQLIELPFHHADLVWAIVPLYFGWLVNELTSNKANFGTALNTGFSFVWSGAHWLWQTFGTRAAHAPKVNLDFLLAVNVAVTLATIAVGLVALWCGVRRKFPGGTSFLGHARFSNYFMITLFPIQASYLPWSWARVAAILIFAGPLWLACHFGLKPLRKK
ncbi:MAG: hypothetical protein HY301_01170 [Verrucomicrobia bacterium]|nr:hypothetical protein [Verrucomicrobiota bacterium]